ncbi:hypothetical protein [Nostoc sp.]|uniref:hypothetical protein n=1 Tax=Nostoc sp. TaxID=1180 RepID=UPI002FF9A045
MPRSQSPTGNAFREAPPQDLRQSRDEVHFQPEAGNEVLKGFHVKLTPMSIAVPPTRVVYLPENSCKLTPMAFRPTPQ